MDHDIIEDTQREMDQSPIEQNIIPRRTTPPIASCIGEFDPIIRQIHNFRVFFHPFDDSIQDFLFFSFSEHTPYITLILTDIFHFLNRPEYPVFFQFDEVFYFP